MYLSHARSSDGNLPKIVKCLRELGITVSMLAGSGVPDIVIGWRGLNYLIEIKEKHGTLTPAQCRWHEGWRGQVNVCHTLAEVLDVIGHTRMKPGLSAIVSKDCTESGS